MAKIAKNLTELIGHTPLMELAEYSRKYGLKRNIVAKLESFNPAGSVKDRVAFAMIEDAEARGALKPGATIIEPTSGNTGVGLAMVATIKGYHLILTVPLPKRKNCGMRYLVRLFCSSLRIPPMPRLMNILRGKKSGRTRMVK
jgi:cysteine synthase